ncbi:hypothetical protein AX16_007693 [Volvariella volvacea WC 439]|nr:hypothetical protein AX16_007693 [Volvariella volvacea WC 439]
MTQLPAEVLLAILKDFVPHVGNHLWPCQFLYRPLPAYRQFYQEYREQLYFLATLREVCSHWYQVITPSLYSTFVFTIYPHEALLRQLIVFRTHPDQIHHLVITAYNPSGLKFESSFRDTDLIEACLAQCHNLHTLEFVDVEWVFIHMKPKDRLRLLQSNRRNLSKLTSLKFWNRYNNSPILTTGRTLIGLGPEICNSLTNLEVTSGSGSRFESVKLPSILPNISRLVFRWEWSSPYFYEKILSRIVREHHRNVEPHRDTRYVVPLRELILDATDDVSHAKWVEKFLKINDLCSTLSILRIRMRVGQWHLEREPSSYIAVPSFIFRMCPALTLFHYFAPLSHEILTTGTLPVHLKELGLQITNPANAGSSRLVPTTLVQVIHWVRSNQSCSQLEQIVIDLETGEVSEERGVLERECSAQGILLQKQTAGV